MAPANTLFMTPEESARVQTSIQDRLKRCKDEAGKSWERDDPTGMIQEATSSSLMQEMASSAFGLGGASQAQDTMVAYAVGCPYSPSLADLKDLQSIDIPDLRLETHHRGKKLRLRRVSPVVELKASSWAVVQGSDSDNVARLEMFLHKSLGSQDYLDLGHELVVKEPYYTINSQNQLVIRIDHPSDLVISKYSQSRDSWRQREVLAADDSTQDAETCKKEGNAALSKKKNAMAHAMYTMGLDVLAKDGQANSTLARDLHRNRAHVNLLLQRYDEAVADGLNARIDAPSEEEKELSGKAYYRAGMAAYSLGNFEDAKKHFEEQLVFQPQNAYAKAYLKKIDSRLEESAAGAYNFSKTVATVQKTQGRADAGNYFGHTEVKSSPGAGRGVFATKQLAAGDIIMCEKAFCVAWSHDSEALSAITCDIRDDAMIRIYPAGLHKAVVQKLLSNPSQVEKVADLFSDYKGLGTQTRQSDGRPVIDTFQFHDVVQRNAFGLAQQMEDEDVSNASTGLWVRAAYLNHSCAPNAHKDFIGDLIIVRATRQINAGEEITLRYDETSNYDARRAALKRTWGFDCGCDLCRAEEADGPAVRKQRQENEAQADSLMGQESSGSNKMAVRKLRRLRESLVGTYNGDRYRGLPMLGVVRIDQWLQRYAL